MKKPRRVAIVCLEGFLDGVPCLRSAVLLLAEHGYLVDVFTKFGDASFVRTAFAHAGVSIIDLNRELPLRVSGPLRGPLQSLWRRLRRPSLLLSRHLRAPYVCFIGVEPKGLAKARDFSRRLGVPFAYFSLELLLSYELSTDPMRAMKSRERELSRQAEFVIIQDEERAGLLMRDNDIPRERFICFPNSAPGGAKRERTDYLRRKYNLSGDVKIVLHSGSLAGWACLPSLMRSTHDWPDDWVLVCHTRFPASDRDRDYTEALKYLAKPGRAVFSSESVAPSEYEELVRSADVGLALYGVRPGSVYGNDNVYHMGLSSGKLSQYLQAGVPVVVTDLPSLRRLTTTYRCGEVVTDPEVTEPAIRRILADYESYARNAVECFSRELELTRPFAGLLNALDRLA